ncbi:DUF1592 domain-containing protein [Pseudobacteriovorax antillogorgiicola]|uniref:DUF1592 domain-containing protein n=1 Tax=Pseudobacteriovorax antillogorgiicola TaxID=1513793 RepID=A0A1Y6CIY6_9BACT|nr:DUF1592 domain-containing protein [Pseudobacteriovorax antillogorgiicola]TCS47929.1 uncharacterized protein DUF1587 [Pseudobacteriovorax antillogorgiicola]SMF57976.1 Protein of unknown function [Pseudobacteriovorax antillogorgiicola]
MKFMFLFIWLVSLMSACSKIPLMGDRENTELASITVSELKEVDYDHFSLRVFSGDDIVVEKDKVARSDGEISLSLHPSEYRFELDILQGDSIFASTKYCAEADYYTLESGPNRIAVNVCKKDGTPVFSPVCDDSGVGRRVLKLLSNKEVERTIADLTQQASAVSNLFPAAKKVEGFKNISDINVVTFEHVKGFWDLASSTSTTIVDRIISNYDCSGGMDQACLENMFYLLGEQIWRKRLVNEELSSLKELYQNIRPATDHKQAVTQVLRGMFMSPQFIYRSEIGVKRNGVSHLDQFEIANALSYLFTGSAPDKALMDLAKAGSLASEDVLAEQALRLLKTNAAKDIQKEFLGAWLEHDKVLSITKDSDMFPNFETLREPLYQETNTFYNSLFFADGTFEDLFLADYTYGNQTLAQLYNGTANGNQIKVPSDERLGILGHGSVIASHSSAYETGPIHRGVFLLEKILCDHMPPPPPSLDVVPPERDPNATTRERFAAHSENQACAACHVKLDGAGFGFESLDPIGRFRSTENSLPVDDSGKLFIDGKQIDYSGVSRVSELVADSTQGKLCYVTQVYRYANGLIDEDRDKCAIENLQEKFIDRSNLKQIWMDLVASPAFTKRK